jgi:hypothetical protein
MLHDFKNLIPGGAYKAFLSTKAEPFLHYREQPPGTPLATGSADVNGRLSLDLPDYQDVVLVGADGRGVHALPRGFTRMVPRLDALVPNSMASGSGDHVLQVQGRGLSISNELYFGAAGQGEPIRPLDQKVITTIIKTDMWAPGSQPVWVVNAGKKSNVLTFTFT